MYGENRRTAALAPENGAHEEEDLPATQQYAATALLVETMAEVSASQQRHAQSREEEAPRPE